MSIKTFLQRQNIEFSFQRYGIDALNYMALGLFASLIIGLILKNLGAWLQLTWLMETGTQAQAAMGAAIGVGVAYALKSPPLVMLTATATGLAGASLGGAVGAFAAALIGSEMGKLVSKTTPVDIMVTPAVSLITGISAAQFVSPFLAQIMQEIGNFITWSVDLQPFIMSIVLAILMGMILTLPISSAAIAIALDLNGLAAGATTIGCCCQMVGFAVMSFKENRWGGLISQGLGTSMLQMPNIMKNPQICLPPIISSALIAPIATLIFQMKNVPTGAGMGTSGLIGQIGTLEAMGYNTQTYFAIALLHFFLPALLTWLIATIFRHKGWIRAGDLKLETE
ncbi:MAG: PTS sugar transporter subunit IIC [Alysiella sp.]|uniref:PTS transporter subunit IIC n=1 Tax=Alysiella sp. TaxID=1872483 RepID=UPI0026DCC99B|nr:PTS sugar transporter subunit IIC [Alysiella sp.]MDO4433030.1 PTS sugar transporter subunit IIC [Alysiella sp.]